MNSAPEICPDLESLVAEFYADARRLGTFVEVPPQAVPAPYRRLLDHHSHMTVALETEYAGPVDLRVLDAHDRTGAYARKLLLTRRGEQRAVLFGLMRLPPGVLAPEVFAEVRAQSAPLGQILIRHDVLREVERLKLWRIEPGAELRQCLGLPDDRAVYGRTARIYCNDQGAIELLEVVNRVDVATGPEPV